MIMTVVQADSYQCGVCVCHSVRIDCRSKGLKLINNSTITTLLQGYSKKHRIKNIQEIDFSDNNIQFIEPQIFTFTNKLKKLNFSQNVIEKVDNETFLGLERIDILDFSFNNLTEFNLFENGSNIAVKELYLSYNPLTEVNILSELVTLRVLNLNYNNEITSENLGRVTLSRTLEVLNLHGIGLTRLPDSIFKNIKGLKEFDISENNITSLSYAVLEKLINIEKLDMSNNPWLCDCGLHPLKAWVTFRNLSPLKNRTSPVCSSPRHLSGVPVIDVSFSQLICNDTRTICAPCFRPTPESFLDPYNYMTGVNIAGSLCGMVIIFLMCYFYDKGRKKLIERRRLRLLQRIKSSANNIPVSDSSHTVSFVMGERDENEVRNTVTFMIGEEEDADNHIK